MNGLHSILLALCLALLPAAPVAAEEDPLTALLQAHRYEELDQAVAGLEARFRAGALPERDYWHQLEPLAEGDARLADALDEWVRVSKEPTLARLLRGLFHHRQAWNARGSSYSEITPQEQFRRMELEFDRARADFEAVIKAQPACNFCYASLIGSSMAMGDCARSLQWYTLAMERDADAYHAPQNMHENLLPKWCGGPGEAERFVSDFARKYPNNPALGVVRGRQWVHEAEQAGERGDHRAALALLDRALAVNERSVYGWTLKSYGHSVLNETGPALEAANRVLELDAANSWAHGQRARLYLILGRDDEALRDIRRGLDLGDRHAVVEGLYYFAGIGQPRRPPDYGKYLELCDLALKHNIPEGYTCTGSKHYFGIGGTPHNKAEAFKWWRIGADRGVSQSMVDVGNMLWNGEGTARDETAAIHYWAMGDRYGDPRADQQLRAHLGAIDYFLRISLSKFFEAANRENLWADPKALLGRLWEVTAASPVGDWLKRYGVALALIPVLGVLVAFKLGGAPSKQGGKRSP
jgi:TPR repeat protein